MGYASHENAQHLDISGEINITSLPRYWNLWEISLSDPHKGVESRPLSIAQNYLQSIIFFRVPDVFPVGTPTAGCLTDL